MIQAVLAPKIDFEGRAFDDAYRDAAGLTGKRSRCS
jgi:hypothetical protein